MEIPEFPLRSPQALLYHDLAEYPMLYLPFFDELLLLLPVSLEIWQALDGHHNLEQITAIVRAKFEDAPPTMQDDILSFLGELKRRGFLDDTSLFLENAPALQEITYPPVQPDAFATALSLADGFCFYIIACDVEAVQVLRQFARAAQLEENPPQSGSETLLILATEGNHVLATPSDAPRLVLQSQQAYLNAPPSRFEVLRKIPPSPRTETAWIWSQLVRVSAFIGQQCQSRGGLLLHSALAALDGQGVLLAGRSGVGKSTASGRLNSPWQSLCDDITLVVRDASGQFWAHPWPTWSNFYGDKRYDNHRRHWNTKQAVPLKAIFLLEQATQDAVRPSSQAEALLSLLELARQASRYLWRHGSTNLAALVPYQQQRFENTCGLLGAIPSYLLDVTLTGQFWHEMEKALYNPKSQVSSQALSIY